MTTGTVELHRVLRAPPERVYRAFLNARAVLALVEACEARSTEFWNTLGQAGADSSAARILQAGIKNLSAARRKLLDRPL